MIVLAFLKNEEKHHLLLANTMSAGSKLTYKLPRKEMFKCFF